MDVLLLDNRDSFTWNLSQAFAELGASVRVKDAATISATEVLRLAPALVCIGPGPRGPADLPKLLELLRQLDRRIPTLGVCLGLQALARAHGGEVDRARAPVHGKRAPITHDGAGLFRGLPSPLWVMRYHSLVVTRVPSRFTVTARDEHGQVMGLRDEQARIEAVQFHPESVGTAGGLEMLHAALAGAGVAAERPKARPGSIAPASSRGPGHREALYGARVRTMRGSEEEGR